MPAFEEAVRCMRITLTVDVRTTKDSKLKLMHDGQVNRTTNGKGDLAQMTFDEIRALTRAAASSMCRHSTKCSITPGGKINIYVDVKQVSAAELVEHIVGHGMAENVVIYSGWISKEIQDLNPNLKIMPESCNVELARRGGG